MWLKATALGLGFQLVSITAQMADNVEFCRILGIQSGKWGLMGCATGYPVEKLSPSTRPPINDVTTLAAVSSLKSHLFDIWSWRVWL